MPTLLFPGIAAIPDADISQIVGEDAAGTPIILRRRDGSEAYATAAFDETLPPDRYLLDDETQAGIVAQLDALAADYPSQVAALRVMWNDFVSRPQSGAAADNACNVIREGIVPPSYDGPGGDQTIDAADYPATLPTFDADGNVVSGFEDP